MYIRERSSFFMPGRFELSGPAFIGLRVRDLAVSTEFYEKVLGFRRDPEVFPNGVAFLSYPIPFALSPLPPGAGWENMPRPIETPAIWFRTANSQVVHDALVEAGVAILRPPADGRFGRVFTFADPDGYAITIYDHDMPPDGWS
jgi:catechol 2,3-dioxygenase-like lactoylglutathione lyase family enzyme